MTDVDSSTQDSPVDNPAIDGGEVAATAAAPSSEPFDKQVRVDVFDCHAHDGPEQHLASITFPYLSEEELVSRAPEMAARIWNLECSAAERSVLGLCLAITDGSGDPPVHGEHTADSDESDPRFAELWRARDRILREHTTDDGRVLTTPLELSGGSEGESPGP